MKKKTEVESKILTVEEIEQFVIDAGSDHVPTFGGSFEGGAQIQQVPDEIAPAILAIMESGEPILRYLEIGAAAGGTAFLMDHFFHPGNIVLIDDNGHPKHHVRPYILRDVNRAEIIGHSQAQGTVDALKDMGMVFDVILIDGDHSYSGVRADIDIYRDFLRAGGFLILHDSALPDWGVMPAAKELKADTGFEFIGEYIGQKGNVCGVALFRKAAKNEGE